MSENRSNKALFLIALFFVSVLSPIIPTSLADSTDDNDRVPYSAGGIIIGDLKDFDPSNGSQYLFIDEPEPVVSAYGFMKQAWIDAGRPGVDDMVYEPTTSGRSSGRVCNPHLVGDELSVPTSGGSINAYVAKTTSTVAFIVQTGRTLSSTVLNNLASSWDSTIYPTMTTYYGKDYQDGRGLAPPDIDNNCQVQIIIYDIDGAYNTGGYFSPSFASSRESVFVDFADITLAWGKSIIAHELEHLLHNAQDPYENLWIDEGNADVAIYLCFGADSTLVSHLNQWTESSELSVRWWNQRFADYGAGFIFTMYLADHLGGGAAVRQLVQDSATGGVGVEKLALSPPAGQSGSIGRTMGQIFANFSIAAVLDSDQGIYGFSNLDLTPTCSSGSFCRVQPADTNSDWSSPWSSTGHTVEGWGIRAFKFTPGGSSPAPLTIRLTSDVSQFDGVVVSKSSIDGLWSVSDLNFQSNVATSLVPGFGDPSESETLTDEVWAITWYASTVADCDYTSCGTSYPQGTVDIEAARITSPASLTINTTETSDRDGDGNDDTAKINFNIYSDAFFEDLDVQVDVIDSSGVVVDSITNRISAGGGQDTNSNVWFTSKMDGQYSLKFEWFDMIGNSINSTSTAPLDLSNMMPSANGSISTNQSQTWENIEFSGGGFDAWGLSLDNNSLPYRDSPVAYLWDFDDGTTSSLKSPTRSYQSIGDYNATLKIMDQGGVWSQSELHRVNVTDDSSPVPIISVNNIVIDSEISIFTNQLIQFSGSRSSDNVPVENLQFQWDWGDGGIDSGIGLYLAQHEWGDIIGENITFNVTLTIFDGINSGQKSILVYVNNRVPYQIYSDNLTTYTYTSVLMPDVFTDDDGSIVQYEWSFPEGVNLGGGITDKDDDFVETSSSLAYPTPSWDTPGLKTALITVTDDDGSQSSAQLFINVLNQIPIAEFIVKTSSDEGTNIIDFRIEDGDTDVPYTFDGRNSYDIDGTMGDSSDLIFNWTFSDGTYGDKPQTTFTFTEPGIHSVSLFVTDEQGGQSISKSLTIRISNPLPIISVKILDAWVSGQQVTDKTPMPEGFIPDAWSHTFDGQDNTFTAPNLMLYFDSDGTRDGDRTFEGKFSPLDPALENWNGIVEYTWDFGDASPLNHEPSPWHSYSNPGEYTVTLTVRDAFGTGDVSRQSFTIMVDYPPIIIDISIPEEIVIEESVYLSANITDLELEKQVLIYRDLNIDDGSLFDKDEFIDPSLKVKWDIDLEFDEDGNGDSTDDYIIPVSDVIYRIETTWNNSGKYQIGLLACDGLGMCDYVIKELDVSPKPDDPPSLSDFEVEDWMNWIKEAGSDLATFIALIAVALILGWLVMRESSEVEDEAKQALKHIPMLNMSKSKVAFGNGSAYSSACATILSKEERRNDESGYIRPLRRRI